LHLLFDAVISTRNQQNHHQGIKNMGININELQPLGGSLLSGSESIMGNLRVLSEDELSLSGGGKGKGDDDDQTIISINNNNDNNNNNGYYSSYFYH
jgi:hypothetical protein